MGPAPVANLTFIFVIIGTLLFAVGILLLRRGAYPKRIGSTPHCPKCEYILAGLENASRCPECGQEVSSGQMVHGERRRRPRLAVFGGLVALLGLFALVVGGTGVVGRVDWYH